MNCGGDYLTVGGPSRMAVTAETQADAGADEEGRAQGGDGRETDRETLVEEVLDRGEGLGRSADPAGRGQVRHHEGREGELVAVVLVLAAHEAHGGAGGEARPLVAEPKGRLVPRQLRQEVALEIGSGRKARHDAVGERVAAGEAKALPEAGVRVQLQRRARGCVRGSAAPG